MENNIDKDSVSQTPREKVIIPAKIEPGMRFTVKEVKTQYFEADGGDVITEVILQRENIRLYARGWGVE